MLHRTLVVASFVAVLTAAASSASAQTVAPDLPSASPDTLAASPAARSDRNLFLRLSDAYRQDWRPTGSPAPDPEHSGLAAPPDSASFPSVDCSVRGTPVIDRPDTQSYTLLQAVEGTKGHVEVCRWLNRGFNISHWTGSTVLFRSELDLEPGYDKAAYDLRTKKTQIVVAADITYYS